MVVLATQTPLTRVLPGPQAAATGVTMLSFLREIGAGVWSWSCHNSPEKQFSIIFMQLCRAHGTLLVWLLGARRSARRAASGCGRRALVWGPGRQRAAV